MIMDEWKKNNKGYSLVEVIVIIAVMVTLGAVVAYGVGMVSGKPVMQCARQMQILFEQNRTVAMGKESTYVIIYKTSDGVMAQEYINGSPSGKPPVKIGESTVDVTCGGTSIGDSVSNGTKVEFDRGTGALRGNAEMVFVISGGGRTSTLTIEALTGKVRIQ